MLKYQELKVQMGEMGNETTFHFRQITYNKMTSSQKGSKLFEKRWYAFREKVVCFSGKGSKLL